MCSGRRAKAATSGAIFMKLGRAPATHATRRGDPTDGLLPERLEGLTRLGNSGKRGRELEGALQFGARSRLVSGLQVRHSEMVVVDRLVRSRGHGLSEKIHR